MAETVQRLLEVPPGYASTTVARYVWQLDDQTRRLLEPTTGLTQEALAWQPAPGLNTMGMLFAHVAVAETHMAAVLIEGRPNSDVRSVLGIDVDDDGLPLAPDGHPPAVLAGRTIQSFADLLHRARVQTKRVARPLTEADLDRRVVRQPEDGSTRVYNVDWSLYHMVEHLAGHRAQIHHLQHLYERSTRMSASKKGAPSAERLVDLILDAVRREYPSHIVHWMSADADARPPRELTPAFFGSFDWHSCVHGHWALARLARLAEGAAFAARARAALAHSLTPSKIAGEVAYLGVPERGGFERPYGLAWLLQLAAELRECEDAEAATWSETLAPLEQLARRRVIEWLPKLPWPVRTGVHAQTALSLCLILDWARVANDRELEVLIERRARDWFGNDVAAPIAYEPSGNDFLSPALGEADLMRRVLRAPEYSVWLQAFLPDLESPAARHWLTPVTSPDSSDGQLAHLDGLNLSRAWMLEGIASALGPNDARRKALEAAARTHAESGLAAVSGEHYAGAHWLGSYAVYLMTRRGIHDGLA